MHGKCGSTLAVHSRPSRPVVRSQSASSGCARGMSRWRGAPTAYDLRVCGGYRDRIVQSRCMAVRSCPDGVCHVACGAVVARVAVWGAEGRAIVRSRRVHLQVCRHPRNFSLLREGVFAVFIELGHGFRQTCHSGVCAVSAGTPVWLSRSCHEGGDGGAERSIAAPSRVLQQWMTV